MAHAFASSLHGIQPGQTLMVLDKMLEPPMDSQILYSIFAVLRAWMVGLILERELLQRPPPAACINPLLYV